MVYGERFRRMKEKRQEEIYRVRGEDARVKEEKEREGDVRDERSEERREERQEGT